MPISHTREFSYGHLTSLKNSAKNRVSLVGTDWGGESWRVGTHAHLLETVFLMSVWRPVVVFSSGSPRSACAWSTRGSTRKWAPQRHDPPPPLPPQQPPPLWCAPTRAAVPSSTSGFRCVGVNAGPVAAPAVVMQGRGPSFPFA
jgi:hypothetical protein